MDHTAVVREKMTERYLLNELESQVRDEFEEHYFDCPECALDVSAGSQFVEHSKLVLAESSEPVPVRATSRPDPVHRGWFAWLRPAFAAPALALLLAVAGYQTLVNSKLQSELRQPQVLPAVSVNVGTWGGGTSTAVPEGQGLLLLVRIPPDRAFVRYTADVHSPGRKARRLIHHHARSRSRYLVGNHPQDRSRSRNLHAWRFTASPRPGKPRIWRARPSNYKFRDEL